MVFDFKPQKAKEPVKAEPLDEKTQAYRDRAKAERQRFTKATDSEFWFAICFQSEAQFESWKNTFGFGQIQARYGGPELADLLSQWKPRKKLKGFGGGVSLGAGISFSKPLDPLAGVEYTGDLEKDCFAEFAALYAALNAAQPHDAKDSRDSGFYFVAVFEDRDAKEDFLDDFNIHSLGDKYLDAAAVAKKLGVTL